MSSSAGQMVKSFKKKRMRILALKTRSHDTSEQMEAIQKLIFREEALKEKMKVVRVALKAALLESDIYKAVLEDTMQSKDGFNVTEKVAKAHALKVARDTYAGEDGEQEEES